jgi:hypothetical protein
VAAGWTGMALRLAPVLQTGYVPVASQMKITA